MLAWGLCAVLNAILCLPGEFETVKYYSSIGTHLLLNTKVVFVSIESQCLQAKCYSSLSILGMRKVYVQFVDVGSGTCLCVPEPKSFQRWYLVIEGPALYIL